jgi:hypothetical protein
MVAGEDLVILVFLELALMVDELERNEQLVMEEEWGVFIPLQNRAVAGTKGADYPALPDYPCQTIISAKYPAGFQGSGR